MVVYALLFMTDFGNVKASTPHMQKQSVAGWVGAGKTCIGTPASAQRSPSPVQPRK